MMGLTPKQQRALNAIVRFVAQHDRAPSYEELARALAVSPNGARAYVLALERRGAITRIAGAGRSVEVVNFDGHGVHLGGEIRRLVEGYARKEKISVNTAVNELLRQSLGAAA